jgi:DNA-binding NarL/FixJ family response regulator
MNAISVMLVDDHQVVTQGLEVLLSSYDDVTIVGSASTSASAITTYAKARPDVVLMDLSMPGVGGIETTRELRRVDPDAKVIILTGLVTQELVRDVIDSGACGYLLKSVSGDELVQAIRTGADGRAMFSGEVLSMITTQPQRLGHDLTPRELDVLAGLTRGLPNKQIARELDLSPSTVRLHVSNILTKLEVANRTAAAMVAREHGLVNTKLN